MQNYLDLGIECDLRQVSNVTPFLSPFSITIKKRKTLQEPGVRNKLGRKQLYKETSQYTWQSVANTGDLKQLPWADPRRGCRDTRQKTQRFCF